MATIAIENLESFTTLTDMAKAIGVDLELWTAVKTQMGILFSRKLHWLPRCRLQSGKKPF